MSVTVCVCSEVIQEPLDVTETKLHDSPEVTKEQSVTALDILGATLDQARLPHIISKAKQWALLHGVQMRPHSNPSLLSTVEYAPMTLFPSPIPASVMREAKSLQIHYNRLMYKVANDHEFLTNSLKNVIKVDTFTEMLWEIYLNVRNEGIAQKTSLGLFRNDYMLIGDSMTPSEEMAPGRNKVLGKDIHSLCGSLNLKQIEFNTIAASFAGLSSAVWKVHRCTMRHAGVCFQDEMIPENVPAQGLAEGLVQAWEHYCSARDCGPEAAIILFVVQSIERNAIDQLWIEKEIFNINNKIGVIYITFQNAWESCHLEDDRSLTLNGQEVAVIYFRDGYVPKHYPTLKEREIRKTMEMSCAIKCPSIQLQLAGCKKVQQELARPGAVERFIKDPDVCKCIKKTFAGQHSLDMDKEGDHNVLEAINNPERFVLKPQREGGGNNVYGNDIKELLQKIQNSKERYSYILMERLFPIREKNYLLKEGKDPVLRNVISELGIYGVYLGSTEEELLNTECGHLLRTKHSEDNEGGIIAGFATLDSPLLVN